MFHDHENQQENCTIDFPDGCVCDTCLSQGMARLTVAGRAAYYPELLDGHCPNGDNDQFLTGPAQTCVDPIVFRTPTEFEK